MKENRIVRIIAKNRKYTRFAFPAIARFNDRLGTYETGQHIIPGVRPDGLTIKEMTGETPLTAEKRERFPFVINPEKQHAILHCAQLDLSTDEQGKIINYKDAALLDFYKLCGVVAESKDSFATSKHLFYIEDKEQEAQVKITKHNLIFEAWTKVKSNTSIRKLNDVALMINYNVPNAAINISALSITQLEAAILDMCDKNPEKVLECYAEGAHESLFVLKLVQHNIIYKKGDAFYDGQLFLGRSVSDVIAFMKQKDNEGMANKWSKLLEDVDGKLNTKQSKGAATNPNNVNVKGNMERFNKAITEKKHEDAYAVFNLFKDNNVTTVDLSDMKYRLDNLKMEINNAEKEKQETVSIDDILSALKEEIKGKSLDELQEKAFQLNLPLVEYKEIKDKKELASYILKRYSELAKNSKVAETKTF